MIARKTPGVYITEFAAFPPSIVGVQTAVPIFIGYSAKVPGTGQPVPVTSLAAFEAQFGGRCAQSTPSPAGVTPPGGAPGVVLPFVLYDSVRLFYANGGGSCYVVSVGDYAGDVALPALQTGLTAAGDQAGPTMIVIPDAVALPAGDFATLARAMLAQASALQDRIALIDVPAGAVTTPQGAVFSADTAAAIADFHAAVGADGLSYGAAYFPFLWTTLDTPAMTQLPPSGALAGVMAQNDATRGVWNAPANLTLTSVLTPSIAVNDAQQGPLNVPLDGKAVNAIRYFVNRGPVVWGARTLDGNSNDWRYIQVRRTIVYIEQSIKTALGPFVFAANDGQTWVTVTAMISSFLTDLWAQGGLMGDKASDAFSVQCGLGSTMTGQDILNGYMIVQVTLQMVRPAEFITLTFKQTMQGS